MKFSDALMAAVSATVILVLLSFPLEAPFVVALGLDLGSLIGGIISFILTMVIVGYIFAEKIWESRMKAITKILALFAFIIIFIVYLESAATDWKTLIKEAYPTATTYELVGLQGLELAGEKFFFMVIVFVLGFIGLYIGSMLKRPAKSK